ncbi:MAG: Nif3-like dinuclear metal center hexameric protein [Bacteroidia bacterium]|nr:MAG: Nif3-like dinuclear metal center hexameric protein [Bacteroidia bacterium]
MLLQDFIKALDYEAPFTLQEDYDNSGIQIGNPLQEVSKALVCLDVTMEVVKEAQKKECDLILSHHPLIFQGLKRLSGDTPAEAVVIEAIRSNIAVVAIHTNLDKVFNGVNHALGLALGLKNLRILQSETGLLRKLATFVPLSHAGKVRAAVFAAGAGHIGDYDCCSFNLEGRGSFRAGDNTNPFVGNTNELHYEEEVRIETIFPVYKQSEIIAALLKTHPYEEVAYDIYPLDNRLNKVGSGMIGELAEPVSAVGFLDMVKQALKAPMVKHTVPHRRNIQRVALCGGSGAFLISTAIHSGADAYVTGDVKYHQFFDATNKILLVDAGHYETEQFTTYLIHDIIKKKIVNFAVLISEAKTNPVHYR